MMTRKNIVYGVIIAVLLIIGSTSSLKSIGADWILKIENMTSFAMSDNGRYFIATCEDGPLCEKGQFYMFDRYGNTVTYGCIDNEIAVMDIADNGAFFIGTRTGYYFSSSSGKIFEDAEMGSAFESISISENGEIAVAGTKREILVFDRDGIRMRKEVSWPVDSTSTNASGDIIVAGTVERIFLYKEPEISWWERSIYARSIGLLVSDDGRSVICGMATGNIWILDSELRIQVELSVSGLTSIDMTSDGKYFVCGNQRGEIFYFNASGEQIWSLNLKDHVSDVQISSDGHLIAVHSGNILLFDSLGRKLQELESIETIQYMYLSKLGEIISYISSEELFFVELSQKKFVWTYEYMLPSRKSIPLDDKLIEIWSYGVNPQSVIAADVNGDGQEDILCSFAKEIAVLNSEGNVLWKKSFPFNPQVFVLDLNKDFVPEVIVKSNDRRMGLYVFDGRGEQLASHEFYHRWHAQPPPEGYDLGIVPLWSDDIDNDGVIEVICQLHAGYAVNPRGFYAFEYPSFEEEWYYPVAPTLATIHFVDIDGDGQVEIVAGSEAPCNGRQVRDTDDSHAYIYAVTLQGEELWTKQIGPEGYKRVYVAVVDLDGDGSQETVGAGWSFEDNWGTLFVLDSEGNYILGRENEFGHSVFLESIADMDDNGRLEILTSSSPSTLVLYDYRLKEVRRKDVLITPSFHTKVLVNDIDADGEKEIVLTSGNPKLLILNTDLEEEWSKIFSSYNRYLQATVVNLNRCKNYLLVLSDKLYAYTYSNNPEWPCVPWIIAKQEKIVEIESSLKEAKKYLGQGDVTEAAEYVAQAEEAYISIRSEGGLEEYCREIEDIKKTIEVSLTETPTPTISPSPTPPEESPSPTGTPSPLFLYLPSILIAVLGSIFVSVLAFIIQKNLEKEKRDFK